MVIGHVVIEESLLVVCRHGLVPVRLQEVVGSLKEDSRVQVTGVLLVGLISLVLQLGVAFLIHGMAVGLLYEKCYIGFESGQQDLQSLF